MLQHKKVLGVTSFADKGVSWWCNEKALLGDANISLLSYTALTYLFITYGGMGEWFIPVVLKTTAPQGAVGSNPASSAKWYVGVVG